MLEKQEKGKNSQFLYGCNTDWNLDNEFIYWLNYWLKEYRKNTKGMIDLTFYRFTYDGVQMNQGELIDRIIKLSDELIEESEHDIVDYCSNVTEKVEEILDLFKMVFWCLWW